MVTQYELLGQCPMVSRTRQPFRTKPYHFSYDKIAIPGYSPLKLGDSIGEASEAIAKRTEEMIHYTEKAALDIREAMLLND